MKSPTIEASRWVGRVLREKWHIDGRIARGGVGTVFAATHKNNGSRVAIKVLHTALSRNADTRSRFLQEGYAANKVNHPGVVRILDDDVTEEGLAFLVMELLEGELLESRRVRKGGKLPLPEVYEIADQLLDVLAAAHDKQIVHRDIKPDNLFLTSEGKVKVLDFGFAQMKSGFRTEQTATGFLLGTPGFMSPEQAVGNRSQIDAQTDIWAAGATLFTLLSGEPVHAAESAAEMLVAAANFKPRSLATVAPALPPQLVAVVDKALAFDKADRWPSARAMQIALRGVPGRQTTGGKFESGPLQVAEASATPDEKTLAEESIHLEELDPSELVDRKPSWQEDTDRSDGSSPELVDGPKTDPTPRRYDPDDDEPTLAARSPTDGSLPAAPAAPPAAPAAPPAGPAAPGGALPAGEVGPTGAEGTLIMQSPAGKSGPHPAVQAPSEALGAATPHAFTPGAADLMFVAGPARPGQAARPAGGRVLVFMLIAVVSMVIVVVTGLLVLAASE